LEISIEHTEMESRMDRPGGKAEAVHLRLFELLMIARIDFALKFKHAFRDERIPEQYEIDEVNHGKKSDQ